MELAFRNENGEESNVQYRKRHGDLEDIFAICLTKSVNMFSGREMMGRGKMLIDLRETGRLGMSGECLIDAGARHGELENRIGISEEITNAKLMKGGEESHQGKKNLTSTSTAFRKRSQGVSRKSL